MADHFHFTPNCDQKSPPQPEKARETPESACKSQPNRLEELLEACNDGRIGHGEAPYCDPMTTGKIVNDVAGEPNRNTIYRYAKSIAGTDEAVYDLFRDVVVIDENGKAHRVPIIWGTQEAAVVAALGGNVREDESLVVDRIKLPIMSIVSTDMQFVPERYTYHMALDYMRNRRLDRKPGVTMSEKYERDTILGFTRGIPVDITYSLVAWTTHIEDMNQIVQQLIGKLSPEAYIRVDKVFREIPVKIVSVANNIELDPSERDRVVKFEFTLTAETYVAQPIVRKKAVLSTHVDITDALTEQETESVLSRIQESVEELE